MSARSSSFGSWVSAMTAVWRSQRNSTTVSSGMVRTSVVPGTSQPSAYSSRGSQIVTEKSSASAICAT